MLPRASGLLVFRLLEVAEDIGKGEHAISGEHVGIHVSHGDVGDCSADAVILVEQIKDDYFQLSLVVFRKAVTSLNIP